jgi:methyl-accepting chemotaxis protein
MLDMLANSGAEIDDTPMILMTQEAMRQVVTKVEAALDRGEISPSEVFDCDYRPVPGSNPPQYDTGFSDWADVNIRPILDHFKTRDAKVIGSAITDVNGYLPTHLTERCKPQGPDPLWNEANCRNRRILMDETTRKAVLSERPAMLATYRMELGDTAIAVKNIFVPLFIKGRRWGNYEIAYRDDEVTAIR